MDEFIDPFGDDSDLLENKDQQSDNYNGFCNNPSHDHSGLDPSIIPDDIKRLPKLLPFVELTNSVADIATASNKEQEEQEAIIYSLMQIIGKEQFDKNLQAARHHQRHSMWDKVSQIYEEVLGLEILEGFSEIEEENSTLMIIMKANVETLIDVSNINRDRHYKALQELSGDYDTDLVSSPYSFHGWEDAAYKFVLEMKSSLRSIIKTVSTLFDKFNAKRN